MVITKLTQLPGIGDQLAARITRHLGNGHEFKAIEAVRLAPYSLTRVPRVGFRIADGVARRLGVHVDSPGRHEAGNRFILGEDGTLPIHEFDDQRRKLELFNHTQSRQGVVEDAGRVWLPEVLEAEQAFAAWAAALPLGEHRDLLLGDVPPMVNLPAGLDEAQTKAVMDAHFGPSPVFGVTGGGGTGKTRVIGGIVQVAQQYGKLIAVAAFAGKAADRVRETLAACHTQATYAGTIHRMLNYTGIEYRCGVLPYDVVVLEEASMIPTMLVWEVIKRLKPGARLVLVGDPGQLPPVGYGQPFTDLLTLGMRRAHLEINYRSRNVQGIINGANAIRAGEMLTNFGDDSLTVQVATDLSEAANEAIAQAGALPLDEWQLITWKNDDAMAFNLAVQEALNPTGFPLFSFRVFGVEGVMHAEVREGDKVMVKANDPDIGIFNGQIGTALNTQLVQIDRTREPETLEDWADVEADGLIHDRKEVLCVRVRIGSEIVAIPEKEAHELLTLGYAVTVHKAQGSDWEHVIIYQPGAVQFDAQRWWYTSVTRAKSRCQVLYEVKVKGTDPQAGMNLWWANTRRSMDLGPSIFVGRVKRELAQQLLPAPQRSGEEWLR